MQTYMHIKNLLKIKGFEKWSLYFFLLLKSSTEKLYEKQHEQFKHCWKILHQFLKLNTSLTKKIKNEHFGNGIEQTIFINKKYQFLITYEYQMIRLKSNKRHIMIY